MTETKADYTAGPRFTALSKALEGAQMMVRGCVIFHGALEKLARDYEQHPDLYHLYHSVTPGHLEQSRQWVVRLMREEGERETTGS